MFKQAQKHPIKYFFNRNVVCFLNDSFSLSKLQMKTDPAWNPKTMACCNKACRLIPSMCLSHQQLFSD